MEFLVTMTTHVPEGTPAAEVDDVRAREAANTRELAAQGHVLRLWRPPLAPGEWRTLGLFAAADAAELERVLATMPLRVWRTDEVKALTNHQNDPVPSTRPTPPPPSEEAATEYLVTFTPAAPQGTPARDVAEATAAEAQRAAELAKQGHLVRLWALPPEGGVSSALGLWRAGGDAEMQAILQALPLYSYLTTTCRTLPSAQQGFFRDCGSSASYIAAFGPQSRQSYVTEGTLFYFAVLEWVPPLSFPALAHDHAGFRTAACTECIYSTKPYVR